MRTRHVVLAAMICGALVAAISCERPTAPDGPSQRPESPTVTHIDIDGPSSVTPDSTTQYRAIAHATDGTSRDVTAQARWVSSDSAVLSLTSGGIAQARAVGESQIMIQYLNLRADFGVLVLSSGTYRIAGVVRESGLPVAGATVEVVESPGTKMVTDALGAYRVYGVAGDIHVRVTKDGYKPLFSTVTVGQNQTLDFALEPVSPLADVSGLYSMTLTADSCGVAPDAERTRTYDAQVTQDGPQLKVALSGARFRTQGDRGDGFTGRIAPDGITFNLTGWNEFVYDDVYFSVVEILAENPSRLLTVSGTVSATRSASGISGFLNGNISAVRALGQYSNANWWSCSSRTHQVVLVRQ